MVAAPAWPPGKRRGDGGPLHSVLEHSHCVRTFGCGHRCGSCLALQWLSGPVMASQTVTLASTTLWSL